ncbi:Uncharacterised protein [Burkholderia pseudomallei]|nr:Uncharacterised protein [Burkholderia pseudomallei]CAJ6048552.1 Uncharacterised protein [Burkholderia pseudomallei]CAJ6075651.1 Uncharacterised protein [Burkholderia pseudomallei]CAJ6757208.1 Uncharacterised protein [Burkholderia pseudomallei]CAJ8024958.1 Uncharacterised protein [Burkholderia pseudomallei]
MTFVEWLELGATATAYAESDALLPGWIALAGLMLGCRSAWGAASYGRFGSFDGRRTARSSAICRFWRPAFSSTRGFHTDRFRARVGDPRVCRRQAALPIHHLSGAETGALARSGIIAARMGTLGPARRVTHDDGGDAPVDRCRSSPSSQQGLPHRVIAARSRRSPVRSAPRASIGSRRPRTRDVRDAHRGARPLRACAALDRHATGAIGRADSVALHADARRIRSGARRPARLRASAPPPPGRHERASGPIRYRRLITIDFWVWRTLFCLC